MSADLVLGTAQLGSAYGINNSVGELTEGQAFDVLDAAFGAGVRLVDSAEGYGKSERIIGDYMRTKGNDFGVCTKLPGSFDDAGVDVRRRIHNRIQDSCSRLSTSHLEIYYLHSFDTCKKAAVLDALVDERSIGTVRYVGVSVYEPSELRYMLDNLLGVIDAVQIPFNVFNCARWIEGGLLEEAASKGVIILARSIYLQGVVFMSADDQRAISLSLSEALAKYAQISSSSGVSPAELACSFVCQTPGIDYAIMGSETPEQVLANASMVNSPISNKAARRAIIAMSESLDQKCLDPREWRL